MSSLALNSVYLGLLISSFQFPHEGLYVRSTLARKDLSLIAWAAELGRQFTFQWYLNFASFSAGAGMVGMTSSLL